MKDKARKLSPWLVPSRPLPEEIKACDHDAVRDWPKILAAAGWFVRRPGDTRL